jgi:hypothetical protein
MVPDWWAINQLRALVVSDLLNFVPAGHFDHTEADFSFSVAIESHKHFSRELKWAQSAVALGRKLFFENSFGLSARQVSASEILMHWGLLASAETMQKVASQVSTEARNAGMGDRNTGAISEQLQAAHVPTFRKNLEGGLAQYFLYLDTMEKAPLVALLRSLQQPESSSPVEKIPSASADNSQSAIYDSLGLIDINKHIFQVALSFPGEDRELVAAVASELERLLGPHACFYDNNYVAQLARPSLDSLLQEIYGKRASLVVVFLSENYQRKKWCGVEFRAIRAILLERQNDTIMFVRTDDGAVEGVFNIDGYVDARRFSPDKIALFIRERIFLAKHRAES